MPLVGTRVWVALVCLAARVWAFNASDIDPDDYVAAVYLHSLPTNGTLYNTTTGLALNNTDALPYRVFAASDGTLPLAYRSRAADVSQATQLLQITDTILYSVSDTLGVPSVDYATLTIMVFNSMTASSLTTAVTEDVASVVILVGTDQSNLTHAPVFVIDSLPAMGYLLWTSNLSAIANESLPLRLPGNNVSFLTAANGFGDAYASFGFHTEDAGGTRRSAPATQTLDATAVNDNFNLSYPTQRTLVPVGAVYRFFVGISDPDSPLSIFRVRLEVPLTSFSTKISLHESPGGGFPNLTFSLGTGLDSPRHDFTGTRDAVNYALGVVSVTRITAGEENITITVTDGSFEQSVKAMATFQGSSSSGSEQAVLKWPYVVIIYGSVGICVAACFWKCTEPVRNCYASIKEKLGGYRQSVAPTGGRYRYGFKRVRSGPLQ